MARIRYVDRDTMPEGRTDLYDRLVQERGERPEHLFLALANGPALTEGILAMASTLRKKTELSKKYRELAVLTVGLQTNAPYEFEHHANAALQAGVSREQLDALANYEQAECFDEQERAVIRYAVEATLNCKVSDQAWAALAFLGERQRLELVVTTAWYNCAVRLLLPLEIELEPWFKRL